MAAAALPAWLSLQSRARTLRAFSTAVYSATPVPTPSLRTTS
ncbi:MRPS35 isoform 5 [Pan troglodytes]|uniref:Mitochondrial ribosomal protein S35 n=2 Tax=Homininae TaxID=207598 RepID=F5H612_HUMAN|nr:MRPS35 isoform 5 [Pan troglodytes]